MQIPCPDMVLSRSRLQEQQRCYHESPEVCRCQGNPVLLYSLESVSPLSGRNSLRELVSPPEGTLPTQQVRTLRQTAYAGKICDANKTPNNSRSILPPTLSGLSSYHPLFYYTCRIHVCNSLKHTLREQARIIGILEYDLKGNDDCHNETNEPRALGKSQANSRAELHIFHST